MRSSGLIVFHALIFKNCRARRDAFFLSGGTGARHGQARGRTAMANHELVLRGGRVIDGTGVAAVSADVAIDGDRITAVGRLPRGSGRRELDLGGLVVAPGFIDVHTHDDRALFPSAGISAEVS